MDELPKIFDDVKKICEDYAREQKGDEVYVKMAGNLPQRKIFECYEKGHEWAFACVCVQDNLVLGGKGDELVKRVEKLYSNSNHDSNNSQ